MNGVYQAGRPIVIPNSPIVLLSRGFIGKAVTVGTTATEIYKARKSQYIKIVNPSRTIGGSPTTSGNYLSQTAVASGNSQATPLYVANFLQL